MKRLYPFLIAMLAVLVLVPPTAAASTVSADSDADEHPVLRWDQQINTTSRFKVLSAFGRHAVLDNETGLVWEKSPSTKLVTWEDAQSHCNALITGNRLGWRLPTVQELTSLLDPNEVLFPILPAGNPFQNVQNGYWSATTYASGTSEAWTVTFFLETVGPQVHQQDKSVAGSPAWCVRGGHGVDPQ